MTHGKTHDQMKHDMTQSLGHLLEQLDELRGKYFEWTGVVGGGVFDNRSEQTQVIKSHAHMGLAYKHLMDACGELRKAAEA